MAELSSEQSAESVILGAVMAPEGEVETTDTQDLDQVEELKVTSPEEVKDPSEEKPEAKAKEEEADPGDDEIEIAVEGGEPVKRKLSEVVADAQAFAAFKGQERETLERIDREYAAAAQNEYRQVREFSMQTGAMIQAALQILQPPQQPAPPNPALMNQDYSRWEQENAAYQQAQWQYGQHMQRYNQAHALGQNLLQQAQAAQSRAEEERDTAAMQQLERKGGWYADFAKDDPKNPSGVRAKFASEMKTAYGYSWDELDAVLTDPRNLEVAQDALAYRAMKAKSGEVKAKVEAKAPKLTRTKTEAKGGAQARDRDSGGRFTSDAMGELKKTNSDAAAARLFAGLVKSGRI